MNAHLYGLRQREGRRVAALLKEKPQVQHIEPHSGLGLVGKANGLG